MLKKFVSGLIFGSGFAIAFIVLWLLWSIFIIPRVITTMDEHLDSSHSDSSTVAPFSPKGKQFFELPVEEQIKASSVIILIKFEPAQDGKIKAIITDILKQSPDSEFNFKVGDEYYKSSYYPDKNRADAHDHEVVFFTGLPANMTMSTTYGGDRISGLGNIPVELFKKKCAQPNA